MIRIKGSTPARVHVWIADGIEKNDKTANLRQHP